MYVPTNSRQRGSVENQQARIGNHGALTRGETRSGHSTSVSSRLLKKYQELWGLNPKYTQGASFKESTVRVFRLPCRLACHNFATVIHANPMAKIKRIFCNPVARNFEPKTSSLRRRILDISPAIARAEAKSPMRISHRILHVFAAEDEVSISVS